MADNLARFIHEETLNSRGIAYPYLITDKLMDRLRSQGQQPDHKAVLKLVTDKIEEEGIYTEQAIGESKYGSPLFGKVKYRLECPHAELVNLSNATLRQKVWDAAAKAEAYARSGRTQDALAEIRTILALLGGV